MGSLLCWTFQAEHAEDTSVLPGLARVQHKTKAMRVCCQLHVQCCGADGVGAFQEAAAAAHQ